jgi:hypothetical protein
VVIATGIGSIVAIAAVSLFSIGSKMAIAAVMQGRFDNYGRAKIERMKNSVRAGTRVDIMQGGALSPSGDRIEITLPSGVVRSYYYQDDDNTSATVQNNNLYVREGNGTPRRLLSYINRSSGQPIFSRASEKEALMIRLRFGDAANARGFNFTGIGVQAVDILTSVSERNKS